MLNEIFNGLYVDPEQVADVLVELTTFAQSIFAAAMKKVHKCSGYYVRVIEEQEMLERTSMEEILSESRALEPSKIEKLQEPPIQFDPETLEFMDQLLGICSEVEQSSTSGAIEINYEQLSYPAVQFLADVYDIKPPKRSKEILIQHLRERNVSVKASDITEYLCGKQ
jgi:hypothetical protein